MLLLLLCCCCCCCCCTYLSFSVLLVISWLPFFLYTPPTPPPSFSPKSSACEEKMTIRTNVLSRFARKEKEPNPKLKLISEAFFLNINVFLLHGKFCCQQKKPLRFLLHSGIPVSDCWIIMLHKGNVHLDLRVSSVPVSTRPDRRSLLARVLKKTDPSLKKNLIVL